MQEGMVYCHVRKGSGQEETVPSRVGAAPSRGTQGWLPVSLLPPVASLCRVFPSGPCGGAVFKAEELGFEASRFLCIIPSICSLQKCESLREPERQRWMEFSHISPGHNHHMHLCIFSYTLCSQLPVLEV